MQVKLICADCRGEIMLSIQLATESDVNAVCSFDHDAQQDDNRAAFIENSILAKSCYIAMDREIKGYAVLEYSFFKHGFISMLYIHPDWRRHGIGALLLKHLEIICKTDKLFTSTNLSNLPMQSMLAKFGYKLCGVIHDLDEGDPELIYVKYLRQ